MGVDPADEPPRFDLSAKRQIKEKYVCIAAQSSSQAKYWNNPYGWMSVVQFLKDNGYRVLCIDKEKVYSLYEEALKKGVKVSGATVHFVTAECDAGPIILQKSVDVLDDDTPEILQKRLMEQVEWKILTKAVQLFCDDKIVIKNGKTYIK